MWERKNKALPHQELPHLVHTANMDPCPVKITAPDDSNFISLLFALLYFPRVVIYEMPNFVLIAMEND